MTKDFIKLLNLVVQDLTNIAESMNNRDDTKDLLDIVDTLEIIIDLAK